MATKVKSKALRGVVKRRQRKMVRNFTAGAFKGAAGFASAVGMGFGAASGNLLMVGLGMMGMNVALDAAAADMKQANKHRKAAGRLDKVSRIGNRSDPVGRISQILAARRGESSGRAHLNAGAKRKAKNVPSRNPARPSAPSRNPQRAGGPRGFANKKVQAAAQVGRRRSR